jgi:hypothetical protein
MPGDVHYDMIGKGSVKPDVAFTFPVLRDSLY